MHLRKSLLTLILLLSGFHIVAQIDKEFWFVAPEIAQGHGDRPIMWRIATMEEPASITLRMPAGLWFSPITATIPANSAYTIDLTTWIDSIENRPANKVLNRGLYMTSDKLVTCYYEIKHSNNPGIFSLKGKNGLGTDFYIVSQNDYRNQVGQESFDIVATEDNTVVTITPSDSIVGHSAGVPFNVTLQKGQTYTARAIYTTFSRTLAGSHITSDKPIAVSWQDDSLYQSGSYDVICDQIIPNNLLGLEYIAIRGFANTNERMYVCGTQDSTILWIDGNPVAVDTIQTGELFKYAFPTGNNTIYLESGKPVHVLHLSGNNNEFGGAILPHDSCTGSRQVGFYRSSLNAFSLMVLTRNGNQDSFYLDGDNTLLTAADFAVVNGTSDGWVFARKSFSTAVLDTGAHLLQNTHGKFHMGILNNLGASSEYGYFSDFSSLYLGSDASICPGDSVVLDGGAYMSSYQWKKLISGTWTLVDTNRFYTVHDSGHYACLTNGDFCTLMDTITIAYYPNASVSLGPDRTICEGTFTSFDPGLFVSYQWSNGYTGRVLTTGEGGVIWVRVTNNNDCIAIDSVNLFIDSLPQTPYAISGLDTVCQEQAGVSYQIDSLPFATSYSWSLPPGASGVSDSSAIILSFSNTAQPGDLTVHGINACGTGPDTTLPVHVKPLPGDAVIISGPDSVCQGESSVMFTTAEVLHASSYAWTLPAGASLVSGSGNDTILVDFALNALPGEVTVHGVNDCGTGDTAVFSLTVNLFPEPAGAINGPTSVCQGSNGVAYSVAAIPGAVGYLWTLPPGASVVGGSGTNVIQVNFDSTAQTGAITVRGISQFCGDGIPSSLAVTLDPLPVAAGVIAGPSVVCQGQQPVAYEVPEILFAETYQWTLPVGVTLLSGAGTRQIGVACSTTASSGVITVRGSNTLCGAGRHANFPVTVNPLPLAAGPISGPSPVCQATTGVSYQLVPVAHATSYAWSYSGSGVTITGNGSVTTLAFDETSTSGLLTALPQNGCGDGPVSPALPVTVNPIPIVSFTNCTPVTTREGKPFTLKGGVPAGGVWTGACVSGSTFTPALAPAGADSVPVTYSYTNLYSCSSSEAKYIKVFQGQPFTCGAVFTDVRDNKTYPTVLIGTQCWMAANLDYGNQIPRSLPMRDNCIPEKYCFNNNPEPCAPGTVLYQWDELLVYEGAEGAQGLCPPGWHVPLESEWNLLFSQFITSGFAGSPLKYSGYSGFNALLSGAGFMNKSWNFDGFATLFWTSTSRSSIKAWAHGFNDPDPSVSRYPSLKTNAFSVRCIKD